MLSVEEQTAKGTLILQRDHLLHDMDDLVNAEKNGTLTHDEFMSRFDALKQQVKPIVLRLRSIEDLESHP